MSSFPYPFQCKLVMCALMIHNFIVHNQVKADEFEDVNDVEEEQADETVHEGPELDDNAKNFRDILAKAKAIAPPVS